MEYPDSWFRDICSDSRFYTRVAVHQNNIVAFIVAEVKIYALLTKEVRIQVEAKGCAVNDHAFSVEMLLARRVIVVMYIWFVCIRVCFAETWRVSLSQLLCELMLSYHSLIGHVPVPPQNIFQSPLKRKIL